MRCQLGERYSGLASVWHNIHLFAVLMQQNVFGFYVNARYEFFLITFIYVKSLHSTGKKRTIIQSSYIIKKIDSEIKRALISDFRYLVIKSLCSLIVFPKSKSQMHCRNNGVSNIVFAKLCVCVETGHRRFKRLIWDCTWTQRKGFGWRRGTLWLWNSYGPIKKGVKDGMEESIARWEHFQRIFKTKRNIVNWVRSQLFPEQLAMYFCLYKAEEIGDFYRDMF